MASKSACVCSEQKQQQGPAAWKVKSIKNWDKVVVCGGGQVTVGVGKGVVCGRAGWWWW